MKTTSAFVRQDRSLTWPEWANLIGGMMGGEFFAKSRVIVEDPKFPGAMGWNAERFEFAEQHPLTAPPYSRDIDHVILRLDPASVPAQYHAAHPDGDFPLRISRLGRRQRIDT